MADLIRFDPFEEMRALQKQFFNDDFFSDVPQLQLPTTDVYYSDDGKQLTVQAHLPDYQEQDIDISIDNGVLAIQGQRQEKEEDKKKKYVVRESSSSFYRRVRLPKQADADSIEAKLEDGVLKVVVPLKELPTPKKIAIGAGKKKKS